MKKTKNKNGETKIIKTIIFGLIILGLIFGLSACVNAGAFITILPDISVDDISLNQMNTGNASISTTISIVNGSANNIKINFLINNNLVDYKYINLTTDSSQTISFTWKIKVNNSYQIKIVADQNNEIIESNESNNMDKASLRIVSTSCGAADYTFTYGNNVQDTTHVCFSVVVPYLKIYKTASKDSAFIGDEITYTLSVVNPGTSPAYDVLINDTMPPGFEYADESMQFSGIDNYSQFSYFNSTNQNQTLNWGIEWLSDKTAYGNNITIKYNVTVKNATNGIKVNTAEVNGYYCQWPEGSCTEYMPGENDIKTNQVNISEGAEKYLTDKSFVLVLPRFESLFNSTNASLETGLNLTLNFSLNDERNHSITVAKYPSLFYIPENFESIGYYDIISDLINGDFNATLIFSYGNLELNGIDENTLEVYYWNNGWTALNATVDTGANTLTVTINHLTVFSIMGSSGCYNITADENGYLYVNNDTILCTGVYSSASIIINSSDIILDCNGSTLNGNGTGIGIHLENKNNVTVTNCNVMNYSIGIYLDYYSSNNTLMNSTVNSNDYGIYLVKYSSNNAIIDSTASLNDYGIYLYSSSNNNIINSTANSNTWGISLDYSPYNILKNNAIAGNAFNLNVYGWKILEYYQDIDLSNTVDGKPVYYWTNERNAPNSCTNAEISDLDDSGFVALVSCGNITVKNLNLANNSYGILIVNTTKSNILNNTANSNNYYGIYLDSSSNNTLTNNTANNDYYGIYLFDSSNNALNNNTARSNIEAGILLHESQSNTLTNNTASSNNKGIHLWHSSSSIIQENEILNNTIGIYSENSNSTMDSNIVCNNANLDFSSPDWLSSSGDNNTCGLADGWKDKNASSGCLNPCVAAPTCMNVTSGNIYINNDTTLCTGVYNNASIIINSSNIILDCNNASLNGNGSESGIYLENKNNVTIKNCNVMNYSYGIRLHSSSNSTIFNSTANSNDYGIYLVKSSNNIVANSKANSNNEAGILLSWSSGNNLTENTANSNHNGIRLDYSLNNMVKNNTAEENLVMDFYVFTTHSSHCDNIMENNTGSGNRTIGFFNDTVNLSNEILSELILCDADNSDINNVTIIGSESLKNNGIVVFETGSSSFTKINSSNNYNGIYLASSSNNNLVTNNIIASNYQGAGLYSSSDNEFYGNKVCFNSYYDFYADTGSTGNKGDNNICTNSYGWSDDGQSNACDWLCSGQRNPEDDMYVDAGGAVIVTGIYYINDSDKKGVVIINSSNTVLDCNGSTFIGNGTGYGIYNPGFDNVTIRNCNVMKYSHGIYLISSLDNTIAGNNANLNDIGFGVYSSSDSILINNTAGSNDRHGIYLHRSSNNSLTSNTASDNHYDGIRLDSSSSNTLKNNTANNNYNGIYLFDSSNNALNNNTARSNMGVGILLQYSQSNTLTNNTASSNNVTGEDYLNYGIGLWDSSSNVLVNNTASSNNEGIHLWRSSSSTIQENEISNNIVGIYSENSNSTIFSNVVCNNSNLDFDSPDWLSSSGDNNTCDNPDGWNDTGKRGCTYYCFYHPCDLNRDGIIVQDYNDLMTAYKCILGIGNCNTTNYQDWSLMRREYNCFFGTYN